MAGAFFDEELVLRHLRRSYNRWKGFEPYEANAPIPEGLALAMDGYSLVIGDFELLAFTPIGFHRCLRPQEVSNMLWVDVVVLWELDRSFTLAGGAGGLFRTWSPKVWRKAIVPHVFIKLDYTAYVLRLLKARASRYKLVEVVSVGPGQLRKCWDAALQFLGCGGDVSRGTRVVDCGLTPGGLMAVVATSDYLADDSTFFCCCFELYEAI